MRGKEQFSILHISTSLSFHPYHKKKLTKKSSSFHDKFQKTLVHFLFSTCTGINFFLDLKYFFFFLVFRTIWTGESVDRNWNKTKTRGPACELFCFPLAAHKEKFDGNGTYLTRYEWHFWVDRFYIKRDYFVVMIQLSYWRLGSKWIIRF